MIRTGTVSWWQVGDDRGIVAYRGGLSDRPDLWLRYGFDGWQEPSAEARLEHHSPGLALASVGGLAERTVVDLAVRAGDQWDNNHGADYRLWIRLAPVDSHLHASVPGRDHLGKEALEIALASAGIDRGVISWQDNAAVDGFVGDGHRFRKLVWVNPHGMDPGEVARRLETGHVGLKLHPAVDHFPADGHLLDVYLGLAAEARATVCIHSGPGLSHPARIARLAARFPDVPVVLYHTYLGLPWGKHKATHLARSHPNLVLETSWCHAGEVEWMVGELGPERVIFGSDASVDGAYHFVKRSVGGRETYNETMLRVVRHLGPGAARQVLSDNAIRLFRLGV